MRPSIVSGSITDLVRRYFTGLGSRYLFKAAGTIHLPSISTSDLYIHIPFCKSMCPYCPYNKVEYDKTLAKPYLKAILAEIKQYHNRLGRIEVPSIYVGGGTPTNLIDELGIIIEIIRDNFTVSGDLYIETTPSDINDESLVKLLRYGFSLISLGVQSFNEGYLKLIGRDYTAGILYPAISKVMSAGFKTVNVDLMFALPGQTIKEAISDIKRAIELGVDQITTYPLFTFPYSTVGKYLKLKSVKMPDIVTRRRMYKAIHDYCVVNGFRRVSVWGFKRGDLPRYSSVTRESYIGLGAGAASYLPGVFYFNTFSVSEYIKASLAQRLPVALKMEVSESMAMYYWLYWRFYDTYIPKRRLRELFGSRDKKIRRLLVLAKALGLCVQDEEHISLTERGAFWLHLMQNYFILNYINKVWSLAMKEPWPERVEI